MLDLDFGAYAGFVIPAFAITAGVFAWMALDSLLFSRRWKARAQAFDERER